jgi:23S rRNA (adenine2503-C2)-methyltransferase
LQKAAFAYSQTAKTRAVLASGQPMNIEQFRQSLRHCGARPCHEERILRAWTQALPLGHGSVAAEHFFPLSVRAALPALTTELGELADGRTVESVLLPREGLCVSSQAGCAVGCSFCMTGRSGLRRQLGSAEIIAQVVLARTRRKVSKVVFMGMGEPAHNMDNVLDAINLLGTAGGIGHKKLVFSTVGDRRVFERLPRENVKPALALSLHTTRAELRAQLLPRAQAIDPAELVELGEQYARATGYPIQYQWTLLEGVNDTDAELDGIVHLLKGRYAVMNFIPYNEVDGLEFRRPSLARIEAMSLHLYRHGILAKLRQSAGQDIAGACGQLRARNLSPA